MNPAPLQIGWAQADITPEQFPVLVSGQFHARVSEGVDDPLSATVLVLEEGGEQVIFVSLDLVCIPNDLRDGVRERVAARGVPGIEPGKIILHATHTHAGPEVRSPDPLLGGTTAAGTSGVDLGEVPVQVYHTFLCERVAQTVIRAWETREPGTVAWGIDYAVIGRNRRWVDGAGVSTMYGLNRESAPRFRHIEGYEDHSLNLLATYDAQGNLSGMIVNIPSPSQESEQHYRLSADFWCETRRELRRRFGDSLFILPQCSTAGDLTSHRIMEKRANERMQRLRNRSEREEIALRIADAVGRILPVIATERTGQTGLRHQVRSLPLPLNALKEEDVAAALEEAATLRKQYEEEKARLEADPSLREKPRWYIRATFAYRRMKWLEGVKNRFEQMKEHPTLPVEVHAVALADIAFASNPFEYYVDYGMQIKLRSPATQTFLIQLAGGGTYVPSPRSVQGGGYGSVPASNPVGPEGGQKLAEETVCLLKSLIPA